ncbi:sigma-54-dependent Fis family transcriptional regulator [Spirochaeta isovalerica]|uniref:Nif-specific regulatory protein n=1 Tax=Spirochaeta isovalerica TaxID=150 RepID=A0A841R1D8_9SPIO|nr:sigma 54-interacting transcriptional regulator [Spirochaeta isovalerica]MBB6478794.1 Nif-specific regulatory protein [Spirochaeta isovalerica]
MFKDQIDIKRFNTLIEINSFINSNYTDVKSLLTQILESASKLTGGDASSLLLVDRETNELFFEIALGPKGSEVKKFSVKMGEGIAGWVAQNNRSLIVNDVEEDPRFFSKISEKVGYATTSILAVPMRVKDQCVGVIEVINKESGRSFTDEDLEWLEIFSTQAGLAFQNAKQYQQMNKELFKLKGQIQTSQYHPFVYKSGIIDEKLAIVKKIAQSSSPILISGDSGTGKELFAEQIHKYSLRSDLAFIKVNCAAIPENLIESELFGHIKGAFTDAVTDHTGRFELADKGTIFLDEIGELPISMQAKLLRVIQHGSFEKVGSNALVKVDVRIIAATNRNLTEEVRLGHFREDLFYRLNVLPLEIPPLKKRREDILPLAEYFLKKFNIKNNKNIKGFSSSSVEAMLSYSWPGNVRELENSVERAVIIATSDVVYPKDLLLPNQDEDPEDKYSDSTLKDAVNLFKKEFIQKTLKDFSGNQTEASDSLGIQRTYLSRLIKELDIKR